MVVAAAVFSLTFRTRTNAGSFVYILLLPLQTATRLRQMLTPSLGGKDGLIDWQNFKPIRSEHWGKPVNRFGSSLKIHLAAIEVTAVLRTSEPENLNAMWLNF